MSREDLEKYGRHIGLEGIGKAGQERIGGSKVLVVGLGGLGSAASIYVAAAGAGTIGLVDPDVVETGNLQRQVLHSQEWIGKPKVESAVARIKSLNPSVKLEPRRIRLDSANAAAVVRGYDVVIDALDSLADRYVLSDAAMEAGLPLVHGSAEGWRGEVCCFSPVEGPCLKCIYREEGDDRVESKPVFGPLAGVVGALQASECLKLLAGAGRSPFGRMLRVSALDMTFREFGIEPDPECTFCKARRNR